MVNKKKQWNAMRQWEKISMHVQNISARKGGKETEMEKK